MTMKILNVTITKTTTKNNHRYIYIYVYLVTHSDTNMKKFQNSLKKRHKLNINTTILIIIISLN